MKLRKEVNTLGGGGYNIFLKIGQREQYSWWSSPTNNISHVGLGYLSDRYPMISTELKRKQFFSLWNNLWIEITDYQKELMQHCIGLSRNTKPYRNYFFTQEDDKDWNELVNKRLAIKGTKHPNNDNYIYFWASKQGVEFILEKSIGDKVYEEL